MYPLKSELPNGATVKDWLGTAATAARMAARHIESVRDNSTGYEPAEVMVWVEDELAQALDEVRRVKQHVAHVEAFSS